MTRLVIATVILAIALVVTKRKLRRRPGADALRVTSRTVISRGVIAAVLETEHRRFLVTISGTSTTVVAELGAVAAAPATTTDAPDFPAALAARLPDAAAVATVTPSPRTDPIAASTPGATPATPAPTATTAQAAPARPTLRVPTFLEADAAIASLPRRPAGQPSVIAAAGDDEATAARRSLLDRARARTVRNYDVAELTSTKPGA